MHKWQNSTEKSSWATVKTMRLTPGELSSPQTLCLASAAFNSRQNYLTLCHFAFLCRCDVQRRRVRARPSRGSYKGHAHTHTHACTRTHAHAHTHTQWPNIKQSQRPILELLSWNSVHILYILFQQERWGEKRKALSFRMSYQFVFHPIINSFNDKLTTL